MPFTNGRAAAIGSGIVVLAALPLLLPRRPGAIPLTTQRFELEADPERVFEALSSFDRGPRILERRANQIVAEFPVRVGWYKVATLERVTLDPDRRTVTFEQLRSPFFSVRTATEVFDVSPGPRGGSRISLHGVLWPRLGAFGWLVTRVVVRPRWDQIDGRFLAGLRQRLALAPQ